MLRIFVIILECVVGLGKRRCIYNLSLGQNAIVEDIGRWVLLERADQALLRSCWECDRCIDAVALVLLAHP